jgi:hypothetical protein
LLNHKGVPNDSHENLLPQQYFKNTIPVIPLLLTFIRLECIWICKYIIINDIMDFYPDVNEQEIGISISEMNLSD